MATPQNVELEAAKFLQKLIQESKDEPTKLATKLYVILQHMRSSGKENSMPYQVISRAMETVIKQHNLDIETLMSSRPPLAGGSQNMDSASSQLAGSSQRVGVSKDSKMSFAGNEIGTSEVYGSSRVHAGPGSSGHDIYPGSGPHVSGGSAKVQGIPPGIPGPYLTPESAMQFAGSSFDSHNFAGKMTKDRNMDVFPATPSGDHSSGKSVAGKSLDHEGSGALASANKIGIPSSVSDTNVLRTSASRDTGKSPISQTLTVGRPFKEQQLKQLRAQCLVFLAFRNNLMPKKLHLEIALGNIYSKEDGSRRDLIDQKGKEQVLHDPSIVADPRALERPDSHKGHPSVLDTGSVKDSDYPKNPDGISQLASAENQQDRKCLATMRKADAEGPTQEASDLPASSAQRNPNYSNAVELYNSNHEETLESRQQPKNLASAVTANSKPSKLEKSGGNGLESEIYKSPVAANSVTYDPVPQRKDDITSHSTNIMDRSVPGNLQSERKLQIFPMKDHWKPVSGVTGQNYPPMPVQDSNLMARNVSHGLEADQEEDYVSMSKNRQPSPKHTTVGKWILDRQKRKFLAEQTWAQKQLKTEQRISACSGKLKESVSSSVDLSAKTKSVIELKKLQLLDLQRQLRSDILNDFFKPIAGEMDRLKSIKKHRIGRRSKQLERYEQKMKEERQKRTRERQKEFFSEIEAHRERLEDGFKIKRERWKGFNRYVREFHRRKERFHREKIDRIQREKINLLKINDVAGYLRMVQDAKSDRVKQLLKETEKYLQKLSSKLKEAKVAARQFDTDAEESRGGGVIEENEVAFDNEDDKDQAKHYLESNEKYYMMAHSIKENIVEQPRCLEGGKLREYQMNGLRWLVSLYNNHLNGILADEMGLGKTVQVISLICYLMETKNDRGPFLVVVPSSVLPGWESEINFWAPSIHKIVYSGPPEERRKLFKEQIVHQKFNVLLTTYEYLMNKHDRPKLSKLHWHYIIIDEGHRIKNASCKLNADLKHYRSNHRLLLTGTPLQNNLEELWALLNFLLPNIFNSSEDFSQWFNKPFESNGDNSPDEALLSEEENLLIINRLHQVLRPFVLRRLKHKVENELPEKIERLIRCEASSYQKLLMKRVEDNLGAIGTSKARSVHNSVMELRNICNHPYLSQLHVEEVHDLIPEHYLPNVVRLCGKLEMLDRLLPKLKATDHRVLFFSTMTRLLDVMEDYLSWKQYRYLRLDGHTSGGDRGALIDKFNQSGSPYFIFLLSIRAGGVGVNLQAADTVIIFDTDWNPQVDLQAQARAHRIGQKKDVLVLRLETVQTVEEQVRASAEHKLGVANQSITAGFFDNNTSAEDRREYLESLLRECKKEEVAPVLDDDSLNDVIARSESEIDVFEAVDKQRRAEELLAWQNMFIGKGAQKLDQIPPLPSRLLSEDDLKSFYEVMKISEVSNTNIDTGPSAGMKRKGGYLGGLDTQQYGRGKRAREVRSYEEQWTEEEFERMCQVEPPDSPNKKDDTIVKTLPVAASVPVMKEIQAPPVPQVPQLPPPAPAPLLPQLSTQASAPQLPQQPIPQPPASAPLPQLTQQSTPQPPSIPNKEATPPSKRGRGRPRRVVELSPPVPRPSPLGTSKGEEISKVETATIASAPAPESSAVAPALAAETVVTPPAPAPTPATVVPASAHAPATVAPTPASVTVAPALESLANPALVRSITAKIQPLGQPSDPHSGSTYLPSVVPASLVVTSPISTRGRGRGRKSRMGGETPAPRRRGKRQTTTQVPVPPIASPAENENALIGEGGTVSSSTAATATRSASVPTGIVEFCGEPSSFSPSVVLPSSGPSNVDLGFQQGPVSISSVSSVPAAANAVVVASFDQLESGIVSSVSPTPAANAIVVPSVGQPDLGIVSSISPPTTANAVVVPSAELPTPAIAANSVSQATITTVTVIPTAQSSIPPPLATRGRGRGRKTQSREEPPQRRRRRQDPVSAVPPQEPAPTVPPHAVPALEQAPTVPLHAVPSQEPAPTVPLHVVPTQVPAPTVPLHAVPSQEPAPTQPLHSVPSQEPAPTEPPQKKIRASTGRRVSTRGKKVEDLASANPYSAQTVADPFVNRLSTDAEVSIGKSKDPSQERHQKEKGGKDHTPLLSSLDSAATPLSPPAIESRGQSASKLVEHPGKKEPESDLSVPASSLVLIPGVSSCPVPGKSEDPQLLPLSSSNPSHLSKGQVLEYSPIEAQATLSSARRAAESEGGGLCQKEDDSIVESSKRSMQEESPTSVNLPKGVTDSLDSIPEVMESSISLKTSKDYQSLIVSSKSTEMAIVQDLDSTKPEIASTYVSITPRGGGDKPLSRNEDEMMDNSKSANLDGSIVSDDLSEKGTNAVNLVSIPEMSENDTNLRTSEDPKLLSVSVESVKMPEDLGGDGDMLNFPAASTMESMPLSGVSVLCESVCGEDDDVKSKHAENSNLDESVEMVKLSGGATDANLKMMEDRSGKLADTRESNTASAEVHVSMADIAPTLQTGDASDESPEKENPGEQEITDARRDKVFVSEPNSKSISEEPKFHMSSTLENVDLLVNKTEKSEHVALQEDQKEIEEKKFLASSSAGEETALHDMEDPALKQEMRGMDIEDNLPPSSTLDLADAALSSLDKSGNSAAEEHRETKDLDKKLLEVASAVVSAHNVSKTGNSFGTSEDPNSLPVFSCSNIEMKQDQNLDSAVPEAPPCLGSSLVAGDIGEPECPVQGREDEEMVDSAKSPVLDQSQASDKPDGAVNAVSEAVQDLAGNEADIALPWTKEQESAPPEVSVSDVEVACLIKEEAPGSDILSGGAAEAIFDAVMDPSGNETDTLPCKQESESAQLDVPVPATEVMYPTREEKLMSDILPDGPAEAVSETGQDASGNEADGTNSSRQEMENVALEASVSTPEAAYLTPEESLESEYLADQAVNAISEAGQELSGNEAEKTVPCQQEKEDAPTEIPISTTEVAYATQDESLASDDGAADANRLAVEDPSGNEATDKTHSCEPEIENAPVEASAACPVQEQSLAFANLPDETANTALDALKDISGYESEDISGDESGRLHAEEQAVEISVSTTEAAPPVPPPRQESSHSQEKSSPGKQARSAAVEDEGSDSKSGSSVAQNLVEEPSKGDEA